MTADMTAESVPSVGAEPVFLNSRCVTAGDRDDVMAARVECDDAAVTAGFRDGFIRPCNPIDADTLLKGSCETCASKVETLWVCFGASPLPD